jgi:hypothetical protein
MLIEAIEIERNDRAVSSPDVWNSCACGELKPKKGRCCWRCIDRDPEFALLDVLIGAGYGSMQQDLIPAELMQRFSGVAAERLESGYTQSGNRHSSRMQLPKSA